MNKALMLLMLLSTSLPAQADSERGLASFYADSLHGEKTASGETYDKNALTAAHRTLEFGTLVEVTYTKTGQSVLVKVNDRGPFVEDRIIDLSSAAAQQIGLITDGVGEVELDIKRK